MFKTIILLKRRPGMSMQEFIDYYESTHSKIGDKYLGPTATRYVRRYLHPLPDPISGAATEPEHDVITEIWYADRSTFEATMVTLTLPEIAAEIVEDEERLFDRSKHRVFVAEEHESDLGEHRSAKDPAALMPRDSENCQL